tara:strand:+ start:719 stop:1267 length:549 start_codon:yes stop_codon:yes gene_type:complete
MFLELANDSIRKMLTHFLRKVVLFSKQTHTRGEHTFWGFIFTWSTRFSLLINEIDHFYDHLYDSDMNIPMRFEIPTCDHLGNTFKTDKTIFLQCCIQFVKNTNRYLHIYDYLCHHILLTKYTDMQGLMFKNSSDLLKGHVLDMMDENKMKYFLRKYVKEESELILDIFYKPLASIGSQFYKC